MTEYKIKSYDESYVEKQVEIGTTFAQKWVTYGQSNVEQVKQVYSRENFDPETRLYCFKEDEMVGYIGATIAEDEEAKIKRAQTRLAFVLPGHEAAFNLLFNELLEVLKNKEVSEIVTPQSKLNDNYYELAENLGFSYERTVTGIYLANTGNFVDFKLNYTISDYNHETDATEVKAKLREVYENITEENAENYINNLSNNENVLSFRVIKNEGKIVAYCAAQRRQNPNACQISLLIGDNSDYKKYLISNAMSSCKEEGFNQVFVFLNPENPVELEESKDFISIGFEKAATYDNLVKKL